MTIAFLTKAVPLVVAVAGALGELDFVQVGPLQVAPLGTVQVVKGQTVEGVLGLAGLLALVLSQACQGLLVVTRDVVAFIGPLPLTLLCVVVCNQSEA